jgi:hypothetical protein
MRKIATLSTFILVSALAAPTFASSPKPLAGAACSKLGLTTTYTAKKFTCIKLGKKIVWDKGASLPKSVPSPLPSQSSSPAPTQNPTPSPSPSSTSRYVVSHPVEGPFGITWDNIVSKFNDIPAAAWTDAQATMARNRSLPGADKSFYSYISPGALKVDPLIGDAETLLKRDFSLFARFPSYPKVYFVALTTPEREETEKLLGSTYNVTFINPSIDAMFGINSNSPAGSVFSAPQCNGNDSGRNIFNSTQAAVIVGVCPSLDGRDVHTEGVHGMAHEYIHMIQSAFAPGREYPLIPCWMIEGETEWGQSAVSDNFSDYLRVQHMHPYRLTQSGLNYEATSAREWTAAEVAQYLTDSLNVSSCSDTNQFAYSYSLGAATTEALVSIAGSESIFALHQRIVGKMPYEQAFKEVYGISWADALPLLSQVVAKKITLAWSPTALTYPTKP